MYEFLIQFQVLESHLIVKTDKRLRFLSKLANKVLLIFLRQLFAGEILEHHINHVQPASYASCCKYQRHIAACIRCISNDVINKV